MNRPTDIQTERLRLAWLEAGDANFIVELLNDPDWLHFIGDKSVADRAAALNYLESGPWQSYRDYGFGLLRVGLRACGTPIGLCGLLKRDSRDYVELGFALLPGFRRRGYAAEAARAVLAQALERGTLERVEAIVTTDNRASRALLERLGFTPLETLEPGAGETRLEVYELNPIC